MYILQDNTNNITVDELCFENGQIIVTVPCKKSKTMGDKLRQHDFAFKTNSYDPNHRKQSKQSKSQKTKQTL